VAPPLPPDILDDEGDVEFKIKLLNWRRC